MAGLFLESFESDTSYSQLGWTTNGAPTISGSGVRTGSQGGVIGLSSGDENIIRSIASTDVLYVGFAFRITALPSLDRVICSFFESSTRHVDLRLDSTGHLFFTLNGSQISTKSTQTVAINVFYYCELGVTIHDSAGVVTLKMEGVQWFSHTSQDTKNGGTGVIDNVRWGNNTGAGSTSVTMHLDDLYIIDDAGSLYNTFLGPGKVEYKTTSGAGASTDFTPSAGSNYQNVDETPPDGDTTYNSSATVGADDTFAMADLTTTSGTVKFFQLNVRAKKDDVTARVLRGIIRNGDGDSETGDLTMTTSYQTFRSIFESMPTQSDAPTISEINAVEAGYKVQS